MNADVKIIKQKQDFEEAQRLITSVFSTDRRLPDQVFNQVFRDFVFEEFDWAMSSEFWESIQQLAVLSNDSYILTAVLEPSPTDYFYHEFGYYNWFKLPVNITADDYWSVLQVGPKGSPVDAMLFNSNIVVWLSPSMKWAVWGERSYGICILAFKQGSKITTKTSVLGSWRSVNEALTDLLPINFEEKKIPKEFSASLLINYSVESIS